MSRILFSVEVKYLCFINLRISFVVPYRVQATVVSTEKFGVTSLCCAIQGTGYSCKHGKIWSD